MSTTLDLAAHFGPGAKVEVHPRVSDSFNGGSAVKTLTVPANGQAKIDGLIDHADYWLVSDGKTVAFKAAGKKFSDLADEIQASAEANAELRSQSGPEATATGPGAVEMPSDIHPSNFEKSDGKEAHPRAAQVDVPKSTPQRSSTPLGTAYPVDPAEIQPQPGKEHVKKGPQRDGAELGYATPVDPDEVQPAKKYEDEKGPQRVGADTGSAEPIAKGSLVEQDKVKDSSVSKALGATVPKKGTSKAKGKAKTAADPVKASAKKSVKKGN